MHIPIVGAKGAFLPRPGDSVRLPSNGSRVFPRRHVTATVFRVQWPRKNRAVHV